MDIKNKSIDFWFSVGSTYTYLTVTRIRDIIKRNNLNIILRPIHIKSIMLDMDNIPFGPKKPTKKSYMFRDIQRRAEFYKINIPEIPILWPLKNFELANKIALIAINEGWGLEYLEVTYYNWFIKKQPAGEEENLSNTFRELNKDYNDIIKIAQSSYVQNSLMKQTNLAKSKGIFGVPTFTIENEIFWGDDRLEDAIKWYNK